MFSAHELNELAIQNDELLYLAPQGFEKWNKIALICFFCLVGQIYSYLFEQKLGVKTYKVRKALFFDEPEQEVDEKLQKYTPKITYAENVYEFEEYSSISFESSLHCALISSIFALSSLRSLVLVRL